MDRLMRLREPAAVVALVGLGLQILLILGAAVRGGVAQGNAAGLATLVLDPLLLLLVAGLVASCSARSGTAHARGLARAGLVLVLLSILAAAGLLGVAAFLGGPGILGRYGFGAVPRLVGAVLALGALSALLRRPEVPVPVPPEPAPAEPEPEPADPQLEPAWTPDAAVGTVWRRAGDAGSQTPDTSWDGPGHTHPWWGPAPNAEPTAESPRHPDD